MTRCLFLSTLALAVGWSGPASGESAPTTGSLTVLSRPDGAAFRLTGPAVIVGRAPMTLTRGLAGRYKIESLDPGYGHWQRTLDLNGATADTIWMTLSRKSAMSAGLRSLVIPGTGQFYSSRPTAGAVFMGSAAVAGGIFLYYAYEYQQRLDEYNDANDAYQNATVVSDINAAFASRQKASERAEDAYKTRQITLGVLGAVWGLNVIDAIRHFPSVHAGGLSLRLEPSVRDAGREAALAVQVRY
ncbi:MAG: hypothetical protein HYR73_07660 [Candidatus Eisenbacteria bacterium]|nr:hypothetical protein [Candidatus Eisenbacteria bacterium]